MHSTCVICDWKPCWWREKDALRICAFEIWIVNHRFDIWSMNMSKNIAALMIWWLFASFVWVQWMVSSNKIFVYSDKQRHSHYQCIFYCNGCAQMQIHRKTCACQHIWYFASSNSNRFGFVHEERSLYWNLKIYLNLNKCICEIKRQIFLYWLPVLFFSVWFNCLFIPVFKVSDTLQQTHKSITIGSHSVMHSIFLTLFIFVFQFDTAFDKTKLIIRIFRGAIKGHWERTSRQNEQSKFRFTLHIIRIWMQYYVLE